MPKTILEIEKEIVREVARGDNHLKMFEVLTDDVSDHNERIRSIHIDKFFIQNSNKNSNIFNHQS